MNTEIEVEVLYEIQECTITQNEAEEWGIPKGMPSATFLVLKVVSKSRLILQHKKVAVFPSGADALTFEKWLENRL